MNEVEVPPNLHCSGHRIAHMRNQHPGVGIGAQHHHRHLEHALVRRSLHARPHLLIRQPTHVRHEGREGEADVVPGIKPVPEGRYHEHQELVEI